MLSRLAHAFCAVMLACSAFIVALSGLDTQYAAFVLLALVLVYLAGAHAFKAIFRAPE